MNPPLPVTYVHGFLFGVRSQTSPEAILHTLNHSRPTDAVAIASPHDQRLALIFWTARADELIRSTPRAPWAGPLAKVGRQWCRELGRWGDEA